jgi:hypothetical protein
MGEMDKDDDGETQDGTIIASQERDKEVDVDRIDE